MSDLDLQPGLRECGGRADVSAAPVRELLDPREASLGPTVVRRLLPNLGRRMVGAWCFVDHYGPDDIAEEPGMQMPPHPHMGLQTVSWLHEGEILHRDSVGSVQVLHPRQLGLMTSGRGIAHAEQSTAPHPRLLHGAQLWVALPDAHRHTVPAFEHHTDLPIVTAPRLTATVIMGTLDGAVSPGSTYTPLVGADLTLTEGADVRLPVEPDFEYAVLTMSGATEVDGVRLAPGSMLYLGAGRSELPLRALSDAGLLLIGGEPFEEKIMMWWNLIGRTQEEITEGRAAWMSGDRFGTVHGYDGSPLPAPTLPVTPLKPRGRTR